MEDKTYLDLKWSESIIEILEFENGSFDSASIFNVLAKKVIDFTNCDKVMYKVCGYGNIKESTMEYSYKDFANKKLINKYSSEILIKDIKTGEFSIYFHENEPPKDIDEIFELVSRTVRVIVARFFERTELQDSQMKTIISALANDYGNITYVDLINGTDMVIKANTSGVLMNEDKNNETYNQRLQNYIEHFVIPEEREEMRYALSIPCGIEKTKNGETYSVGCRIMINGKLHYRNIKFVPQMEDGKVTSIVIGYHSTDSEHIYQEKLEEALKQAQVASTAKSSFLFNMSHDIRTPMNAIIGMTALAKKHVNEEEKVKEYLGKISTAGDQLLSLINKVLEMSRIESGNIELNKKPFNIFNKVNSIYIVYNELCAQKGLSLNFTADDIKYPNIISDSDRIDQIIGNLLGNATKYTLEGGKVFFSVSQTKSEKPNTCLNTFVVEDTGIGMSEEFVKHVFDEFSRESSSTISRVEGTGLGMSIVKKVVDLLGGTIDIESKKGVGTKITFRLETPYEALKEEKEVKREINNTCIKGLKVLLAEDNELNREITTEILTEQGMIVKSAVDGLKAYEAVKNSKPGEIDIILMDIQMPVMDGYEATRKIRKLHNGKKIPIIALSANAFEEDKQRSINEGMNDHVAKPIDIFKLISVIAKYI